MKTRRSFEKHFIRFLSFCFFIIPLFQLPNFPLSHQTFSIATCRVTRLSFNLHDAQKEALTIHPILSQKIFPVLFENRPVLQNEYVFPATSRFCQAHFRDCRLPVNDGSTSPVFYARQEAAQSVLLRGCSAYRQRRIRFLHYESVLPTPYYKRRVYKCVSLHHRKEGL